MTTLEATVKNADRLMTSARALPEGIQVAFADGRSGVIPFSDIRGVDGLGLAGIELPSPYEIVLLTTTGEVIDLPWDFARHYCDHSYRAQAEAIASLGRSVIGRRVRRVRKQAGMTQEQLAEAAKIGRVTLIRIENGEQSPRFETLTSLADALQRPAAELLVDDLE